MPGQDLHLTKSHLLRRLLQRQVEHLETENVELKKQIGQLEVQLTHSTERHEALRGGMREAIAQTVAAVRSVSSGAQLEADITLKVARSRQQKLLALLTEIAEQEAALDRMMDEAVEGIAAIEEQVQSSRALLLRDAHQRQEQLTANVERLYEAEGNLRLPIAEARDAAQAVQERAQLEATSVREEAVQERERLLARLDGLEASAEQLRRALATTLQLTTEIATAVQGESSRAMRAKREAKDLSDVGNVPPRPAPPERPRVAPPREPAVSPGEVLLQEGKESPPPPVPVTPAQPAKPAKPAKPATEGAAQVSYPLDAHAPKADSLRKSPGGNGQRPAYLQTIPPRPIEQDETIQAESRSLGPSWRLPAPSLPNSRGGWIGLFVAMTLASLLGVALLLTLMTL